MIKFNSTNKKLTFNLRINLRSSVFSSEISGQSVHSLGCHIGLSDDPNSAVGIRPKGTVWGAKGRKAGLLKPESVCVHVTLPALYRHGTPRSRHFGGVH